MRRRPKPKPGRQWYQTPRRRQNRRRKLRRQSDDAGLNITSMMDMMTIILVFLLKSYSTDDVSVAPHAGEGA